MMRKPEREHPHPWWGTRSPKFDNWVIPLGLDQYYPRLVEDPGDDHVIADSRRPVPTFLQRTLMRSPTSPSRVHHRARRRSRLCGLVRSDCGKNRAAGRRHPDEASAALLTAGAWDRRRRPTLPDVLSLPVPRLRSFAVGLGARTRPAPRHRRCAAHRAGGVAGLDPACNGPGVPRPPWAC